jgi:hypothetical protein
VLTPDKLKIVGGDLNLLVSWGDLLLACVVESTSDFGNIGGTANYLWSPQLLMGPNVSQLAVNGLGRQDKELIEYLLQLPNVDIFHIAIVYILHSYHLAPR